jgi:beta-glucanase (GH16 family)
MLMHRLRTFYPGDDPYWTGVDLHYWPTGDFEWYDPSAITTSGGNLVITMTQESIHDLNFKSGMLQSWNQLCFQYSVYLEVRVSLPGTPAVGGFWPGVWMMGNLGRPGYGATTDGTWPYTYDSCDLGTLKNQSNAAGTGPAAIVNPDGSALS